MKSKKAGFHPASNYSSLVRPFIPPMGREFVRRHAHVRCDVVQRARAGWLLQ